MNILYISELEGGKYTGPFYSVPKQIDAQSLEDNVYWVNLSNIDVNKLNNKTECKCVKIKDFRLDKLPIPFNKPDLVIFEEFFKVSNCILAKKIEKKGIPYIIIPRCQMTTQYMNNKKIKKRIASILLFRHFAKKSKAVQFLSKQEYLDSKKFYDGSYYIISNGIDMPIANKKVQEKKHIIGTFIGRYSIVQKGLDMLIDAVSKERILLESANVVFELYGPDERTGDRKQIEELVNKYNVTDLVRVNGPVFDNEKREVLLKSDFFVHTSRFEGLPMSVLEALSYGIPCLLTDGTNLRNEIDEYNAGWGADTDVESIQIALKKLVSSINEMDVYKNNATSLACEFNWTNIANKTHKELLRIMNKEEVLV